jgi:uncharacterized protein YwgA
MSTRDILLLAYDAFGGKICGKTKLQKKLYFISIMLRWDLGYGPHYYGPYSADVANSNQELKSLGYVTESIASAGAYNDQGFEVTRHDFTLTEDARTILDAKKRRNADAWTQIESAAARLTAAGDLSYLELSVAAKAYFLLNENGSPARTDELVNMARKFGWSVTEQEVTKAVEFLKRLDLATAAQPA